VAGFDYESPGDMLIARFKVGRQYAMAEVLADLVMRALDAGAGEEDGAGRGLDGTHTNDPSGPCSPGCAGTTGDTGPAGSARRTVGPGGTGRANLSRGPLSPDTILVPIPASQASLRRRGFNPAAELARALALRTGLPLRRHWLVCAREGPKQSTLTRAARLEGAIGRYACVAPVPACSIALVDDVMTTGSTLHAAALALRGCGVSHIVGLVAARAPVDDGGTLAQYRLP
jgi:predicted amidophosphoribosyltransferase